jgi:IS30 family transposase
MKQKGDLTLSERLEIEILLRKKYSMRSIAAVLGRSPNTVSYEIKENSVNGIYDARKAHAKARVRKRFRKLEWSKLDHDIPLRNLVILKLKEHWNPDEIAGWLKKEKVHGYVSKTAIYEWLRTSVGERYCVYLYSKRKRVKKRKPKFKRVLIPNRVSVHRRFKSADNRTRYGHAEQDAIVSKKGGTGALAVLQERKSRLVLARKTLSMSPTEHVHATARMREEIHIKSITYDNGIENRYHELSNIPTFFCDPYSSWQKPGVENVNKMIRRYFPKGTDFADVSQVQVDQALSIINNKPRKILGYRSALEVARNAGIIKSESVLIQG